MKNYNTAGKKVIRQDGYSKVKGDALFADDYKFVNMLYGVMVRIPTAHAEIKSVDYSNIRKNENLIDIIDAGDIPGEKNVGPIRKDQPVFCSNKVVTPGDVICMLVGESERELRNLRNNVIVDYEEFPVLTNPSKSMGKNAPLIHPEYDDNLIIHYPLRKGNIEEGFNESENIYEDEYQTQLVEHAYLETETVTALPLPTGRGVKIIGSIQNPHSARNVVASVTGLPLVQVIIEQAELGGSFGGKDDTMNILSARAAVASLKVKRPVKLRYDREESILESYKRHPYKMKYKVGYNNDGKIKAMEIDILADGGAYSSMSPFVTWRTVVQATGPYEIENVQTDVKAVYTNNPYTGAMRGFGSPQPIFAQESIMDEIAYRLEISPAEIRRINGYKQNSITASGQKLVEHQVNLIPVLEKAVEQSNYESKFNSYLGSNKSAIRLFQSENLILKDNDFTNAKDIYRQGVGLALSFRGCSLGAEGIDAAAAYLSLQKDGSAYLISGLAENGQGMKTTFSIIAAEIFGIDASDIYYLDQNTSVVPDSGPTVASRSTIMGGGAVKIAAETIRERLIGVLQEEWNEKDSNLEFRNSQVYVEEEPSKNISFKELCELAYSKGVCLAAIGWNPGPKVDWDEEVGQGAAYFTYVYGCQVAEVTVNTATGEVFVDKVTAVHDPGKVINLLGAQGQVFGGVTQGAGYGLWEEVSSSEGFPKELNYDQYLIPTSKDIGDIEPIFIEGEDPHGAWGAKSLGEPTLELTSAAISNAIRNATGRRYKNLPVNIEEVLLNRKLRPGSNKRGSSL